MPDYHFERESRTPFSEAWTIEDGGDAVGRVDIHFTDSGIVYATLCVTADVDDDELQDLIAEIDEGLVLTSDPYRDDFVVTVWRGEYAGVYSEEDEDDDDDGGGDEDDRVEGNGRGPVLLKPNG
ncbi:MAG TPA: hypothetical protein VFC53_10100 [Dehalococcoidia bacterium]|nr:hypothetical protein [Dehalococcoidia bacterium]